MRMQKSSADISFTYNVDGIRTSKTVNNVEHIYTLEGSRIVSEAWGDNLLIYLYDESGAPIGMQYRNTTYAKDRFDTFYYEKNLQGDVVAVYNSSGTKVISYTYDAWGNQTVTWHNSYSTNFYASYNPFRYRGYYYDTDTGFYYLQSRYYNPQWGRFLNADGYVSTGSGLLGYNMYTYCLNNPITKIDYGGAKPGDLFDTPDDAAEDFGRYINEKSIAEGREYSSYVYSVRVSETRTITIINPNTFGKNIFSNIWNCLFNNSVTKTITVTITVTKYSYSKPMAGTIDNVIFPVILHHANVFRKKVALLHTHGNYVEKYRAGNDNFSDTDKWAAKIFGVPYYVATPVGTLRKYDPRTDTDVLLFSDLPFDPNHP